MILQYKGFNNNWCYEEANTIIWSNVYVGKESQDYRDGGIRYKHYLEEIRKLRGLEIGKCDLDYAREMHDAINKVIKKETQCADDIVYLIGDTKFNDLINVCVVTLKDSNKYITYVFDKTVYILNNSGGTVQKIF